MSGLAAGKVETRVETGTGLGSKSRVRFRP